jgi:DNA-binding response OmpR family regulator
MDSTNSILLTEEDPATRAFLADNLIADGYDVVLADSKAAALAKLETRRPDMVICDVNGETLDLLDAVRRSDGLASRIDPDVPLIVLTARADELSRVRYFDRGGDDVVTKPFSYAELRARIRALLHRAHRRPAAGRLRVGPLTIDPTTRETRMAGARVELSKMEFALLRARDRADARVDEGRASARRLGLPRARPDAHARQSRLPSAPEARGPRGRIRSQRVGRGLPPGRRPRRHGGLIAGGRDRHSREHRCGRRPSTSGQPGPASLRSRACCLHNTINKCDPGASVAPRGPTQEV